MVRPAKENGWETAGLVRAFLPWAPISLSNNFFDDSTATTTTHQQHQQLHTLREPEGERDLSANMSLTNESPEQAARAAKISSRTLATLPTGARNAALDAIHDALAAARDDILVANAKDLKLAQKSAANGELSPSILKRLDLSRKGKFDDMLQGIKDVRELEDPGRCPFSSSLTLFLYR